MKNLFLLSQSKTVLHRKRITRLYHESMDNNIISLIAGPGYGKTQSVMSFVSELDAYIIWIPFSRLDNYTVHFWANFCNGLGKINETFSDYCRQTGFPDSAGTMYRFLRQLQKHVDISKPLLFIFDDCHLIEESAVCIFIYNLMKAAAEYATAFFISRSVGYLNAENNLQGHSVKFIDEDTLAFTVEETAEYFRLMNVPLPMNLLHSIYNKTEGWPVAVCLFALYGRENSEAAALSSQLTDDILLAMIDREIFSHYTPENQKLLLKLSLLDFLPARYVEEVYGKEALVQISSNLLIRYNAHSHSYSLHQLLKDFLNQHTGSLGESEIQSTYRIAAQWFTKYNLKIDALHCYEYLQDDQNLWQIIWDTLTDSSGPSRELLDYLQKILEHLEHSTSFHNAWLPVAKAIYYAVTADFDLAEKGFNQVIEDYSTPAIKPGTEKIIGEAQVNIALIRMLHGDTSFRHYFTQACQHLPQGSITQISGRMIVLNGDTITLHSGKAGELDAWIQAHRENSEITDVLLHNTMHGMADLVTAQAYYYRGDMLHAEQYALNTLHLAKEKQCIDIVGSAYYLLEKISMYRGHYAQAYEYIKSSYAYMKEFNKNPHYNLPEIAEGYFFIQVERGELMKDWIINDSLYYKSMLSSNYGLERLLKGQYFLQKQHYSELLAHLDYTKNVYEQSHRFVALIYTHLLYAFAYNYTGQTKEAVSAFETAYKMAAPNKIIMPFVEMGHFTRTLCRLIHSKSTLIPAEWLDMIQTKSTTYRKRMLLLQSEFQKEHTDSPPPYQLTSREKHMLRLLSQGLVQGELVEEMHISINTVKSIQKNIYAKLGAFNSTHAMYIAMKDNLLE